MNDRPDIKSPQDWVRRAGTGFAWWCLPLCVGLAAKPFALSARATAVVWMVSFLWMGTGCILNAVRCRRLHCYISGPVFLTGAAALGLFAARHHGIRRTYEQHRLRYADCRVAVVRAGDDLEKIRLKLATAVTPLLNRWADDRPIGTEHTTVAGLRLEQRFAVGALVEILARIRGHDLLPRMATARAGQDGLQDDAHGVAMTFDGKPASVVA